MFMINDGTINRPNRSENKQIELSDINTCWSKGSDFDVTNTKMATAVTFLGPKLSFTSACIHDVQCVMNTT